MGINVILQALFLLFVSTVFADPEYVEFKGLIPGVSDVESIKKDPRFECADGVNTAKIMADELYFLRSSEKETIAGVPIKSMMLCFYFSKLESIKIDFESNKFIPVLRALSEKYGKIKPILEWVQNRMGVKFENATFIWEINGTKIKAERFSRNLEESSVSYSTEFSEQEFNRRNAEAKKIEASDL